MREQGNGRSGPDTEIYGAGLQLVAQQPCDGWAGRGASVSGNRSDGDAIGAVIGTSPDNQQTGQTSVCVCVC